MQSTTVLLSADELGGSITALGARSGLLWRSPALTLAGLGTVTRTAATTAVERLSKMRADLPTELAGVAGVGPIAFCALPFDPMLTDADVLMPAVTVGSLPDGPTWLSTHGDVTVEDALAMAKEAIARPVPVGGEPTAFSVTSRVTPEAWRDEIVAGAVERLRAGEFNKVVLARELVVDTDRAIDPAAVVDRLAATFPAAMVFLIDGFFGASPELLISRSDTVVQARPLAGTAPRGADHDADQALADELLASGKNRTEHRITIEWFLNELLPFCSYVDAEAEPSLLTIANLHHLQTLVEGVLSSPPASALELVRAVHPTPAVGGDPQEKALAVIDEIERAERGRYAGPTGWLDADGNGEFCVSVRSAQIDDRTITMFVGVGVVADSDPQAELDETRTKAQAILGALLRP